MTLRISFLHNPGSHETASIICPAKGLWIAPVGRVPQKVLHRDFCAPEIPTGASLETMQPTGSAG